MFKIPLFVYLMYLWSKVPQIANYLSIILYAKTSAPRISRKLSFPVAYRYRVGKTTEPKFSFQQLLSTFKQNSLSLYIIFYIPAKQTH